MTTSATEAIRPSSFEAWPSVPYEAWKDTCATLRLWTQIVGKIRLVQTPWINHTWHVTFYVTARGLTTSPIPYGDRLFEISFDFLDHLVRIDVDDGRRVAMKLEPRSVANFYAELMARLAALGFDLRIDTMPNEIVDPIPFEHDDVHASYDPESVTRFFRALSQANRLLQRFRAGFVGKASPVHFFWGSFDLAVTRFSGRAAPMHPGGVPHLPDWVTRECYSQEVSSAGFWPGDDATPYPAFYSYAYPEPAGFGAASAGSSGRYVETLHEFVLPYEAVRASSTPDAMVLEFLESTYAAAATLGRWDRGTLEQHLSRPPLHPLHH